MNKLMRRFVSMFAMLAVVGFAHAQQTINGTVTEQSGNTLVGATVVIKGTTNGTITDVEGKYEITASAGEILVYSFIGYKTREITVADQKRIDVKLEPTTESLEEVVVIGYGVKKKEDATGATAVINENDFGERMITSPGEMLQGKVSGVEITQNSGEPGSGLNIRIRGVNSIRSNNNPLYVVDGMPIDMSSTTPNGIENTAGFGSSAAKDPLNFLNPDDIESISILKDASATAIYGSRGANGVVIITTKGGTGKSNLSYSSSVSLGQVPSNIGVMTPSEFRTQMTDLGFDNDYGASTNWEDEIYRTAISTQNNLAFSNGNKHSSYRASFGYTDQQGVIEKSYMKKYNARLNSSHSFFDSRLSIDANISYSHLEDSRLAIGETGGYEGDLLIQAIRLNPTMPVYNDDGTYYDPEGPSNRNPMAMINLTDDQTRTNRMLGQVSASLKLTEGLNYKTNISVDMANAERKINQSKDLEYVQNYGRADINTTDHHSELFEQYLTYDFNLNSNHALDVLAGYSYQNFVNESFGVGVYGFTTEEIEYADNLGMGTTESLPLYPFSSKERNELQSFFSRINYSYLDKYLLTVNFRRDGSTRFGENNKYGNFPSAAVAWKLHKEDFLKDIEILDELKLRVGWGITGNQEIPNKITQLAVGNSADAIYILDGQTWLPGLAFLRTPNPDLKWEQTEQTNIGIDFSLWTGRLTGAIDYFHKVTTDALIEVTSIAPAPTTSMWQNIDGEIINSGIELGLNGHILSREELNWHMGVNMSFLSNTIEGLPVSLIETGVASGTGLSGTRVQVIMNNEASHSFYGKVFTGFDENGMSTFKDADGDGISDLEILGDPIPDFTFSIKNDFSYKNWNLSFFIDSKQGFEVYNNTANAVFHRASFDGGQNTTPDALATEESFNNSISYSSRFIEDGSFIRLSSLTLGYNLNAENISLIKNLRVYATATNLLLITDYSGYDPEVNTVATYNGVPSIGVDYTTYPRPRTYQLGIKVNF